MNLSFRVPTSTLFWAQDLFDYIQAFKSGTLPNIDAVYEQNGALILPQITGHGAGGPIEVYFGIKFGNDASPVSLDKPITALYVWSVVNGEPESLMIQASQVNVFALDILAMTSATALEKYLFRGDDVIGFAFEHAGGGNNTVRSWAGNDIINAYGSGGTDEIYGGTGNDRISIYVPTTDTATELQLEDYAYGGAGNDFIIGSYPGTGASIDHFYGGSGNDTLVGYDGSDTLMGGAGNDFLSGWQGRDVMDGGSGNDQLTGMIGADTLTGGSGVDRFNFTWGGTVPHFDSGPGKAARDVVTDFTRGEDLLLMRESVASPVLTLLGDAAFTTINQVRWVSAGGNTTVFVNGDADLAADMAITLLGVTDLTQSDFQVL
jgi:Ca2+-binding RTX toxin-like protein